MGALGDFFQGAYAYSEQERLRQVEEDNKFKLYEKQQRLVNSLADEDRKTTVVEWEPRPSEGVVVGLNANGDVVTTRPMDKMSVDKANLGLAQAATDQKKSALDLALLEGYGEADREADIRYKNAAADQASGLATYYRSGGAGAKEPALTPGQLDAIGKEAYEIESELRQALDPFVQSLEQQLRSTNESQRKAAPEALSGVKEVRDVLRKAMSVQDPVKRRDMLREIRMRAASLGVPLE